MAERNRPTDRREEQTTSTADRRSILKSALGVGGSATLAGCFGNGDGSGSPTDSATGTDPTASASATDKVSPTDTRSPAQMTPSGPSDSVVIVPPDGDVQGALEDVAGRGSYASSPWGTVRLQAGETYEVSETIEMPLGSILEFNGARMVPTENVTVISMSGGTHLKQPYIDARQANGWDSAVVEVTSRESSTGASDPVHVDGMRLFAHRDGGTGVRIIDDNGDGFWSVFMNGAISYGDVGLHLKADGEDSWVNSCFFDGVIQDPTVGVRMEEVGDSLGMDAHWMNIAYQPDEEAEWFWDLQSGHGNVVSAVVWDTQNIEDGTFWRIGQDTGSNNQLVDIYGQYSWDENVVENKIGGAPNGAAGNALFNFAEAQAHLDLKRTVEDLETRLQELENS